MQVLVVHGGCEESEISQKEIEARETGVARAYEQGYKILKESKSAVRAVEETIKILEDDPSFDAGISGSFVNMIGDIEMDAAMMDSNGKAGGIICIKNFRHPISIARKVMEEMPHVLLTAEGAELFARLSGFQEITPERKEEDINYNKIDKLPDDFRDFILKYREKIKQNHVFSTVGAVAIDDSGLMVAATSTGGIIQKFPGRVGDTPILGAGTFASSNGAASATGLGEGIIKQGVTRKVLDMIENGVEVQQACNMIIAKCQQQDFPCGVIAIDTRGNIGIAHNGFFMPVSATGV